MGAGAGGRRGRRFACVWLMIVLAALPAAAQGRVRFDRKAHLEQYEALSFSEFFDLYDLAPFLEAEGGSVDSVRLTELQSAWAAERARVAALLEVERAEPRRWELFLLERALAKHPFFSKIGWTRLDDVEGFVVYVQDPKRRDPQYALRVAQEVAQPLARLRAHFRDAYARPAGLTQRPEFVLESLFVLSSTGDFESYAGASHATPHYAAHSDYNGKLRLVVVCETPFEPGVTPAQRRAWAQHAYSHHLLRVHDAAQANPLQEDWLREGLAAYLSGLVDDGRGGLRASEVPSEVLRRLLAASGSRNTVLTHLWRIGDLYRIASYAHVDSNARLEARRVGREPETLDFGGMYFAYWRQSLLLVEYLHHPERLAGFLRLLADELAGRGGPAAFQRTVCEGSLEDFDRDFFRHLFAEHRRRIPGIELSAAGLEALLAWDADRLPAPAEPAVSAPEVVAATPGGVSVPSPAPPAAPTRAFEPADLAPRDLAAEARLALALDLARRGRSVRAQELLEGALELEAEPAARARLERALEQVAAWNRLRGAWFEGLAAAGGSYRIEHGGRALRVKVLGVEGGRVRLEPNRAEVEELDADELDPLELVKQMGKEVEALPDAWIRVLPAILNGDRRAPRSLDRSRPQQAALAEDVGGDLPVLLARGFPLGELDQLSRAPLPNDALAAAERLGQLEALLRAHGAQAEVAALRPAIRAYARLALRQVYDEQGPGLLLRGKLELFAADRMRLTYDFSDPAQMEDFVRDDDFLRATRARLGELVGQRDDVAIRSGGLVAHGRIALRHRLAFRAALKVRYEFSYEHLPELGEAPTWQFLLGICADRQGNYAAALNVDDLEAVVRGRPLTAYAPQRTPLFMGQGQRMELEHDGAGRLRLTLGGATQQELLAEGLGDGELFLLVHSDYLMRLEHLVVEGSLEPGRLAAVRETWLDQTLQERGF